MAIAGLASFVVAACSAAAKLRWISLLVATLTLANAAVLPAKAESRVKRHVLDFVTSHKKAEKKRPTASLKAKALTRNRLLPKKPTVVAYAIPTSRFLSYTKPSVNSRTILGRASWVCSPSGLGRRSNCYARS